jgi:hypothetical protein
LTVDIITVDLFGETDINKLELLKVPNALGKDQRNICSYATCSSSQLGCFAIIDCLAN